ncbi:hypothetical protein [Lysinibacillus sp. IITD104]|uniref:hypothetical protein n=1 Tax=Lysinibacillus sp. IITD104 TaxID=3116650 RepID=UPI002FD60468
MKLKLMSALMMVVLLTVGCTDDKTPQKQEKEAEEFLEQLETTKNETLESQVENEKAIIEHQLFIMEKLDIAGGKFVVGKEVKDDEAKHLAEKYSEQLKKEYPNLSVVITIIRDGKEITSVELD